MMSLKQSSTIGPAVGPENLNLLQAAFIVQFLQLS